LKIVIDIGADPAALAALRRRSDWSVECIEPPEERARELDPERIRDADVCFCTFPPANHAIMERLRWIQIGSTGYTQLTGIGLAERGIRATNARGCFDVAIGEWNLAMMINLVRNVRRMMLNQESAIWDRSAIFQNEIRGHTVGLWGYGGIGRETARLAKSFGMNVHVLTRNGIAARDLTYVVPGTGDPGGVLPDRVFRAGEELEFLRGLDFLVVAMPLSKSTQGLIGERELRALPPHAFVLNPARGPIIVEAALIQALREQWIAGAALDTHYSYPTPPEHPLWRLPGVIFTPHISGSSLNPKFKERLWDIFTQNLDRLQRGEPLLNELTPEQLAGV
jgi:phosphoglycerate dehydrogenase-like enzyme